MGETATSRTNQSYFPALDGLRAIAFVLVFTNHYLSFAWGWAGVDLFFVLSGFLITGILYDTREDQNRFQNFYIRRTLRIFPLYYGVLLGLVLLYPIFRWQWDWRWLVWPTYTGNFAYARVSLPDASPNANFVYAHLVSPVHHSATLYLRHFWSLCVEEQFYLVWPAVVFLVKDRRRLMYICSASLVVCPLARLLTQHLLGQDIVQHDVLYRFTPLRVDALLLGGLLALLRRGGRGEILRRVALPTAIILTAIIFLYFYFNPWSIYSAEIVEALRWPDTIGLVIIDLFSASLLILALDPGHFISRLLNWHPLRRLGTVSYGAYLFHDMPHHIFSAWFIPLQRHRLETVLTAIVGFSFTLVASWASFRFFESPILALKNRWAPRSPAQSYEKPEDSGEPVPQLTSD